MSVVDYQEKLRTKSCALFLKLRFWIPPCAKPTGREQKQCDRAACLPHEEGECPGHGSLHTNHTGPSEQHSSLDHGGEHSPTLPTPWGPHTPGQSPTETQNSLGWKGP